MARTTLAQLGLAGVETPEVIAAWETKSRAPRRYDPLELPTDLLQIVGHTGHLKAYQELPRWREAGMDDRRGGLRTLTAAPEGRILYRRGLPGMPGEATVWMADPEMYAVADAAEVDGLDLAREDATAAGPV